MGQHPAVTWDFSCADWASRLATGRPLIPDLPLDLARADRAVAIWDNLRLPDQPGFPRLGEAGGDWFRDIVRVVCGSMGDDGVRRVPEVFALVPKKQSKTTYSAALLLTLMLEGRLPPRADLLFIAPSHSIAEQAFEQAKGMIECDEEGFLKKRFHVREHLKLIRDRVTGCTARVKTFSPDIVTGTRPVVALVDELHLMGQIHYADRVLRQIRGNLERIGGGLLLMITTQSDVPPAGVFKAELQAARNIRDGNRKAITQFDGTEVMPRTLPVLYEFPESMQRDKSKPWSDPRTWHMVMPNLGRSARLEGLVAGYANDRDKGPGQEKLWISQHLNIEMGMATHDGRWAGADWWEAACRPEVTLDYILKHSEVATIGIDGGGLDDLLGLAIIGRHRVTGEWLLWGRAWAQDDVLERRPEIAPRLLDFARDGDLVMASIGQDVDQVAAIVEKFYLAGLLPDSNGVGLDPQGVSDLVDAMAERGIHTSDRDGPVCAVFQGYKLSHAVWGMERRLKAASQPVLVHPGEADGQFDGEPGRRVRGLVHAKQNLMDWVVSNARSETRGNAVLVTKQVSGRSKIDPLCAAFNAFSLMCRNPAVAMTTSPWDDPAFSLMAGAA